MNATLIARRLAVRRRLVQKHACPLESGAGSHLHAALQVPQVPQARRQLQEAVRKVALRQAAPLLSAVLQGPLRLQQAALLIQQAALRLQQAALRLQQAALPLAAPLPPP